jgi:hypothetical protein
VAKVSNTHSTMTAKASRAPRVEARTNRAANQVIIAIKTVRQAARKVGPKDPSWTQGAPGRSGALLCVSVWIGSIQRQQTAAGEPTRGSQSAL